MKKIIFISLTALLILGIILLTLFLGLRGLLQDSYLSKEEIFDAVNSKYDIIMSEIHKGDFKETKKIKGIIRVNDNGEVIEFACKGKGNAVSGAYFGFYYTEDDLPKVSFLNVLFTEKDLIPKDNGFCFDKYDYYYTEKIRDNFYYYELHY